MSSPPVLHFYQIIIKKNNPKGTGVTEWTGNQIQTQVGEITPKLRKPFLRATRHNVLFYISTKYHQNIPKGIYVTELTGNQIQIQEG